MQYVGKSIGITLLPQTGRNLLSTLKIRELLQLLNYHCYLVFQLPKTVLYFLSFYRFFSLWSQPPDTGEHDIFGIWINEASMSAEYLNLKIQRGISLNFNDC